MAHLRAEKRDRKGKGGRQNMSDAVIQQRGKKADEGLDDFPTPPWATRALCEHIIRPGGSVLEPAAGRGYMSEALARYFEAVTSADIADYGYYLDRIESFCDSTYPDQSFDWVITNPPFGKLAEQFIRQGCRVARHGVAMLTRLNFIDTVGRYERLFSVNPPDIVAQFSERVPMVEGRVDAKASTATAYAWLVWQAPFEIAGATRLMWIKPCRRELETTDDYRKMGLDKAVLSNPESSDG